MKKLWAGVLAGGLLLGNAAAQSPSVTKANPIAALPGKTTEITFGGANLREITGLWSSFPATAEFVPGNGKESDKVTCRLTVPASTPVGIGAVRIATKQGISSQQLFMVDDLPTVTSDGKNTTRPKAQVLKLPVAVEGACDEGGFDYYKFSAKAGQTVSVEAVAQRLGSKLDPVVRLLDATGRELAYSDDEPGIGGDSRFAHKFSAKGEYFIEVRDLNYQGGAQYKYRLRVGDFPLATVPYPLGARADAQAEFVLKGRGMENVKPVSVMMPRDLPALLMGVKNPGGQSSGYVSALVTEGVEWKEIEPNDMPELATQITIPSAVNGRFLKLRDRDYYQFAAQKGQKVLVTTRTRILGSPSELFVQLQKADGTVVADASEGSVTNTFGEAGTYRLLVEDITHRGGPEHGYRVEIEAYQGFTLSVESDKVDAPAGGGFTLKVTAARRDFKAPITLTAVGLPEGARLENNVIAEDKNETTLKVKLPGKLKAGDWLTFRLTGRASGKEGDYSARVSTLPALRALYSPLPNPPMVLDGLIGLGVTATKAETKKGS